MRRASRRKRAPDWYTRGLPHIWLPYTQMKTANPPFAAERTRGTRIVLADGTELVDGIASWWTAVHGYSHPHIVGAIRAQAAKMPHVMLGGLVHEQALTLARGSAPSRPAISPACSSPTPARSRWRLP